VLPSVLRLEAFGIVQLEALVLGTPVLASDLPGVREVVEHTGGGYLFERGSSTDLAAKIGEAMADWEGTLRRAESGRSYVLSHYSWDAIAAELEQVYFDAREKPLPVYAKSRSKLLRAFES
jgi:N-acetyllactosaminide 3-alpha-galactosyltransferase